MRSPKEGIAIKTLLNFNYSDDLRQECNTLHYNRSFTPLAIHTYGRKDGNIVEHFNCLFCEKQMYAIMFTAERFLQNGWKLQERSF